MHEVSQGLSLVHHMAISPRARAVQVAARDASEEGGHAPHLTPIRAITDQLAKSVEDIAQPEGDPYRCDRQYLKSQLAIGSYYAKRERMLEAFSVFAELWASCAVRVALAAGLLDDPLATEPESDKHSKPHEKLGTPRVRKRAADASGAVSWRELQPPRKSDTADSRTLAWTGSWKLTPNCAARCNVRTSSSPSDATRWITAGWAGPGS